MLLKVVSDYDVSVLSMKVMGFQRNFCIGWVEIYTVLWLDFLDFFNFAKLLNGFRCRHFLTYSFVKLLMRRRGCKWL